MDDIKRLGEIEGVTEFLEKHRGEVYFPDGFFFALLDEGCECSMVGEREEKDGRKTAAYVVSPLRMAWHTEDPKALLAVLLTCQGKVKGAFAMDATPNNIRFERDMLEKGESDLSPDEYEPGSTAKALEEVLSLADAVMVRRA